MTAVSAAKPTLWRDQLFIAVLVLLAAWLGVVHALAAGLVFVAAQNAHVIDWFRAMMKARAASGGVFDTIVLSLVVPVIVLWMPLDWMRWRLRKGTRPKPALWLRLSVYSAEGALIVWVILVTVTAAVFVFILGGNAQPQQQLMAAFAPGSDVRPIVASAAWVAGPTLVLWLLASWGRAALQARARRDAPQPGPGQDTLLAAAKEKE
jgi:hypothetical protein